MPHAIRSAAPLILLGALLVSCSKDSDNPSGNNPPPVNYAVSTTAVGPTTLGTEVTFTVTLSSTGFSGPVTLRVTGAPASWLVSIADSTWTLTANGSSATTVSLTIPTDGEPAENGDTLTVEATSSLGVRRAATVVTVANEYIAPIVSGAGSGAHWGALAGTTIHLHVGTTLTIRNNDTTLHNIHANGTIPGFPHQNTATTLAQGEVYSNVLTGTGTDAFYCHVHGPGTGSVTVIVP